MYRDVHVIEHFNAVLLFRLFQLLVNGITFSFVCTPYMCRYVDNHNPHKPGVLLMGQRQPV